VPPTTESRSVVTFIAKPVRLTKASL
jgi:hypothetical protein